MIREDTPNKLLAATIEERDEMRDDHDNCKVIKNKKDKFEY